MNTPATQLLQDAFLQSHETSFLLDSTGRIIIANQRFEKFIGQSWVSIKEKNISDFCQTTWKAFSTEIATKKPKITTLVFRHAKGDTLQRAVKVQPFQSGGDDFFRVDVQGNVIPDELYSGLLTRFSVENVDEAIFWIDKESQIRYVNQSACDLFGYSFEELTSMRVQDINPDFTDHQQWETHWHDLARRKQFSFDSRGLSKSGNYFPTQIRVNYLEFLGENYNCAFLVKRHDPKKEALELEQVSKELETLLYHSSHALRSPITTIAGLLELLNQHIKEEEGKTYLSLVGKFLDSLKIMLQDLGWVAELKSASPLSYEKIETEDLYKEVLSKVSGMKNFDAVNIEFHAEGMPLFYSDHAIVSAILFQLVSNSIKHRAVHKESYVQIRATVTQEETSFQIKDNGKGILEKCQPQVFDMFYRANNDQSLDRGLGLYIVNKCVEKLEGHITMESELDKGTLFTVILPNRSGEK